MIATRLPLRDPVDGVPLTFRPHGFIAGAGTLASPARRWPVVDDIAYVRIGREGLCERACRALDRDHRTEALVTLLADQDDWARTPPATAPELRALVTNLSTTSFRDAMTALALGPVATYFAHRWSDPTYLAGLALLHTYGGPPATSFELACGAGHYLADLAKTGTAATGGDVVFAKLWLARHFIAPRAELVCFDAAAPWPLAEVAFDLAHVHDALYFLPAKPHVAAELQRILAPHGAIVVTHAHNALADNLSAGEPLAPAGYAALFPGATLFDDAELTRSHAEGRLPRASTAGELARVAAIALYARADGSTQLPNRLPLDGPWHEPLRRNPLYAEDSAGAATIAWPSRRYEVEYAPLATYPLRLDPAPRTLVPRSATDRQLARTGAYVALPERW